MSEGGSEAGRRRSRSTEKGVDGRPHPIDEKCHNIAGAKIGMSGRQYDRAKHITANTPPEIIEQLDKGECTIYGVYDGTSR